MDRERTLKLFADDDEWSDFNESIPRDCRKRFEQLARCVEIDLEEHPERRRGRSYIRHRLRDCRAKSPSRYLTAHRRGRFLSSWNIGVERRHDGKQTIDFSDGITWGSIGQIFGYLFGNIPEEERRKLFDALYEAYKGSDRGSALLEESIEDQSEKLRQ